MLPFLFVNSNMKKIILLLSMCMFPFLLIAQTGKLMGHVYDQASKEKLAGATIYIYSEDRIDSIQTDSAGEYRVKPLPPGKVVVKVKYAGFKFQEIRRVLISPDKPTYLDIYLSKGNGAEKKKF